MNFNRRTKREVIKTNSISHLHSFKMFCNFLLILCFVYVHADHSVSFPNDTPMNGSIQNRFGWAILGNYFKALDAILGTNYQSPVQTPLTTVPSSTEDLTTAQSPSTPFQVFEFSTQTLPSSNGMTFPPPPSFPTGNELSNGFTSSGAESESISVIASLTACECMPISLCTNQTLRGGATTRIVTRPPAGTVCGPGEVYCCIENTKLGCGIPNIVSGVKPTDGQADLGEFPWSAVILTNDDVYVGGGILIDAIHVLTAAHKVARYGNGAGLKIRLGDWDLSSEEEPVKYLEVPVSKIVNHPKFEATTLKNDISLITLATPVATLTSPYPQINTLCLPEPTAVFTGSRCKVAGWGKDSFNGKYQNIIKKVEVPVLSSVDCQTKLRKTRLGGSFVLDTNSFLCAGGEASRDACTGDGGTALACLRNGEYYLAGITAGGIECGNENVPGLYVNVVNYLTWVNAQINGNIGGIDPRRRPT